MGQLGSNRHVGFYSGVIVESVAPNYYEGQEAATLYNFTINGSFLTNLPSDAKAWVSQSNDNPTGRINQGSGFRIVEQSFFRITFELSTRYAVPVYLGCITSADGSIIYWVNNSRPLP